MFISKELAHAMAEGRKKFCCVYEGRALLIMPFVASERHVSTHYAADLHRSIICTGEGPCRYHHLPEIAKKHVGCWVHRQHMPYADREGLKVSAKLTYSPERWAAKIVELTESCFEAFEQDQPPFGTMAIIARLPGRKNNKVEFSWLRGKELTAFPPQQLTPEQIVPAVIRGTYYPGATVTALDNSDGGPTKHKLAYPTYDDLDGCAGNEVQR